MKLKSFMSIAAIIVFVFGLAFLLVPVQTLSVYGGTVLESIPGRVTVKPHQVGNWAVGTPVTINGLQGAIISVAGDTFDAEINDERYASMPEQPYNLLKGFSGVPYPVTLKFNK